MTKTCITMNQDIDIKFFFYCIWLKNFMVVQEKIADPISKYHRQLKHTGIDIGKNILCIKKKDANEF